MTRLEPAPPSPFPAPAGRSYVGYRRREVALNVRLASGEHAAFGPDGGASLRLAEAVLSDRLGHTPCGHLLEAFVAEWVRPLRGEFFWPVEAVDEWLAAAIAAGAPDRCSGGPLDRALALIRRVLRAPLAHHPVSPTTPLAPGAR